MNKIIKKESTNLRRLEKSGGLVNHESLWLANFTSDQTKRTYATAFREFCGYLGIENSETFRRITSADVIVYRDWLMSQGKSNRSVRNRLAAMSSCFKFLLSHHLIDLNPVEGVERPKVDESAGETPAMTPEQVKCFLQQPDINTLQGARDSAILKFLFYTGSRIGSPRSIRVKDFYQDKGFYVLKWKKKGGTNQVVPVHPELQTALLHYLDKSDHRNNPDAPLFAAVKKGRNQGQALVNETYVYIWNKYRKIAGLPTQFTPHSSRATFATTADEKGVPIQDIQATLGHANISTTQSYIHSRKQYKDSAVFSVKY